MSLTLTRRAAALVALALALASLAMTAGPAHAAKPRYTNATNVARDCPIHWNYPKAGVSPDSTWPAGPSTTTQRVGVRYTIKQLRAGPGLLAGRGVPALGLDRPLLPGRRGRPPVPRGGHGCQRPARRERPRARRGRGGRWRQLDQDRRHQRAAQRRDPRDHPPGHRRHAAQRPEEVRHRQPRRQLGVPHQPRPLPDARRRRVQPRPVGAGLLPQRRPLGLRAGQAPARLHRLTVPPAPAPSPIREGRRRRAVRHRRTGPASTRAAGTPRCAARGGR